MYIYENANNKSKSERELARKTAKYAFELVFRDKAIQREYSADSERMSKNCYGKLRKKP